MKNVPFCFQLWSYLGGLLHFYTSGNKNEYPTVYLFNVVMTHKAYHIVRGNWECGNVICSVR